MAALGYVPHHQRQIKNLPPSTGPGCGSGFVGPTTVGFTTGGLVGSVDVVESATIDNNSS